MEDLRERAVRGGFAKVISQGVVFSVRLGSMMLLARLLDPKEFGLVAMAAAVTGVFNLFKDAGLSMVTVQRATISDEQISTLFWVNMLVGLGFFLICIALAPLLVVFYHEPHLLGVTVALGAGFLVNAAGVQHLALLQRQMRFMATATIEAVSQLLSGAVGVAMAVAGFGYWALVGMALAYPTVTSAGAWLAARWIPGVPQRNIGIGSMLRFGGTVSLNGLVVYVAYNLDKVLLGRFWGASALGIYGRAYQLINIPTDNLNSAVGGVIFSALSRVQHDQPRYRNYFLKGYSLLIAVTLPITIACAIFAEEIVQVALGARWADASPIVRRLAPTIAVFALINPLSGLLFSSNLVVRSLKMALVIAPVVIVSYLIALPFGPQGVAFGYSSAMLLLVVPMSAWAVMGTPVHLRDLAGAASKPLASGAVAVAVCLATRGLVDRAHVPLLRLLLGGTLLVATYAGMLLFVMGQKKFYVDLLWRKTAASPAVDTGQSEAPDEPI